MATSQPKTIDEVLQLQDQLRVAVTTYRRTANGWVEWTTKDGQTLDAVKRQAPQSAAS